MSRGNHPKKKTHSFLSWNTTSNIYWYEDIWIYEASWGIMRPVNEMLEHARGVTSWWSSAAGEMKITTSPLYVTGMISNNGHPSHPPKTDELSRSVYCSLSVDPVTAVLVENCWGQPQTATSNSIWHGRIPVGHGMTWPSFVLSWKNGEFYGHVWFSDT